jgi:transposase
MLRTSLTDSQRSDLQTLRRTDLPAVPRDRLEMVLMSAAGWSPPRIAEHLGRHPHTVRAAIKGFAARGTAALYPDAPGPAPDHDRRAAVTGKLFELLGRDRTWTAKQLAEALGPDIGIGHRQTRRYLSLLRAGYRRTAQTVSHKQDAKKVERAEAVLSNLKKKLRRAGCGCSTWTRSGSARRCRPGTRGACPGNASGSSTSTRRGGG